METTEIEKRGRRLREALDRKFEALSKSGALSPSMQGTDVSDVLKEYISPGIAFDDAEAVLRAAGFTVRSRPGAREANDINRPSDWFAVVAQISPYRQMLAGKVDLAIKLLPRSPSDYGVVTKATATFFSSIL